MRNFSSCAPWGAVAMAVGCFTALAAQEAGGMPPEYYVHFENGRVLRAVNTIAEGPWTLVVLDLRNQFSVPTETIANIEPITPEAKGVAIPSANVAAGQPAPPGYGAPGDLHSPPYGEPPYSFLSPSANPQAHDLPSAVQGVPNVNVAPFTPPVAGAPPTPTISPAERKNLLQMRNSAQFFENGQAPPPAPLRPN